MGFVVYALLSQNVFVAICALFPPNSYELKSSDRQPSRFLDVWVEPKASSNLFQPHQHVVVALMVTWTGPDGVGWKRKRGISDYFLSHSLQMVMVLMLRMVRGPDGEGGGASASSRRHLHPFPPQESPTLGKYIQILLFYVMP